MQPSDDNPLDGPPPPRADQPQAAFARLLAEMRKVAVGQDALVEQLLVALLCEGQCLFAGAPGSIQHPLVQGFAAALQLTFRRISCTPDLAPAEFWEAVCIPAASAEDPGTLPQVLYAEEIHRAPPRTQAALLDAVLNQRVLWRNRSWPTPLPFLLVGSENIEEVEPRTLTRHQLDRFLFNLAAHSPSYDDEFALAASVSQPEVRLAAVVSLDEVLALRRQAERTEVPASLLHFVLRLIRGTRVHEGEHHDFVYEWIHYGAGPRAAQQLIEAARTRAALYHRQTVLPEDVRAFAHPVLRHRIGLNENARSRGVTVDDAIDRLLSETSESEE